MRQFAKPMSLAVLSLEARVLYSCFIVFLLAGTWSSAWLWRDDELGVSPARVRAYYLGAAAAPAGAPAGATSSAPASSAGPALELPSDAAANASVDAIAKSPRTVIETFHFHLFTVPVCLLIVGHLFMMCRWGTRAKVTVLAAAGLATFAHLFGPLLVRFVSAAFAPVFVASACAMAALWTLMLVVPLVEMWRPPPSQS